jgi:hypothetical protein
MGKQTQVQPHTLVQDARRRLHAGHVPAIFTNAYAGYASAILEAFGYRYPCPSPRCERPGASSVLRWPQGLAYGQVKKQYTGSRVERVEVRALYGKARPGNTGRGTDARKDATISAAACLPALFQCVSKG